MKKIIVTGGAGFIGSALIRHLVNHTEHIILNVDSLTYAGNLSSLKEIEKSSRYSFIKANICDKTAMETIINEFKPTNIMHLAAESHVDRSIDNPDEFIKTNIFGTYNLLETFYKFLKNSNLLQTTNPLFQHISTDEVYGSLGVEGLFTEETPYSPRSPYSASKASSDHLVMAWYHTYKLPVVITNCSNNYGPYHFPEKLIPLIILNAMHGRELPIYGKGENIRDWLYVEDHAKALTLVMEHGKPGENYNVGGNNERTNLEVVETVCSVLDNLAPNLKPKGMSSFKKLITFVKDRPGHDLRYAIDASKLKSSLGWKPEDNFESGIHKTVKWYLDNEWWWRPIRENKYKGERLGN